MNSKVEWIWRAVVALFAVFIGSKILLYLLKSGIDTFLSQDKRKDKDLLDQKIDNMVEKINRGEFGPAPGQVNKDSKDLKANQVKGSPLDLCLQEYEEKLKTVKDSKEAQELKDVIPLINDVRWGSGKGLKQLTQDLGEKLRIPENIVNLSPSMMEIMREKLYLRQGNLLGVKDLINLIKGRFVLELLFIETSSSVKNSYLLPSLSRQYAMDTSTLIRGVELYLAKIAGKSREDLFSMVFPAENPNSFLRQIDSVQKKKLTEKILFPNASIPQKVIHFSEIFHELKKRAELVLEANELFKSGERGAPKLGPDELKEAYQALGVSMKSSEEELKSAFNKLAKRNHPDRMATMNVSEEKMRGVNNKFAELKNSYDLIKVWLKRKKKYTDLL